MIQSCILLGTLGVHSIEDIRDRKITVTVTLFSGILGVLQHLLFQNQSIYAMLAGVIPGLGILGISYFSKGKIGVGDGMVFMLTGLYLGFFNNLMLMCISFFLAGVWGIFLLLMRRCGEEERMPLIPFLFLGYAIMMIGGLGV